MADPRRTSSKAWLIVLIGVFLLLYPVALGHAVFEVWPAVEEVAERGRETDVADEKDLSEEELAELEEKKEQEEVESDEEDAEKEEDDDAEHDEDDDEDDDGLSVGLFWLDLGVTPGQAYILLIFVFGFLGAYLHTATSFATYVGMKKFRASWGWWYMLRPFIGAGVALVLVVAIIGGLVTVTSASEAVDPEKFNPYSVAAFAALAGWFSKVAADKLEEIFETILANAKDAARSDKLGVTTPDIDSTLVVKDGDKTTLTITGTGFKADSKVLIDGQEIAATVGSAGTTITVELAKPPTGEEEVVVVNSAELKSKPKKFSLKPAPTIGSLEPATVTAGTTEIDLTITGTGFDKEATVKVGGAAVTPAKPTTTELKVTVPGPVTEAQEVVVTNPDGQSATTTLGISAPGGG